MPGLPPPRHIPTLPNAEVQTETLARLAFASAQTHSDDSMPRLLLRLPVGLQPTDLFRGEGRDPYVDGPRLARCRQNFWWQHWSPVDNEAYEWV
jgi:hypothetical protein